MGIEAAAFNRLVSYEKPGCSRSSCLRTVCMAVAFSASVCWANMAAAEEGDSLKLFAAYGIQTDSNLFRLSGLTNPTSVLGRDKKSDRINVATAGLRFDKEYSLQRIQLSTSLVNSQYETFDYLDHTDVNYKAAWLWALTPHLRGTLGTERSEVLNSFADYTTYSSRNIRTDKNIHFDGEADLGAAWRVVGYLESLRRTNELPVVQDGDSTLDSAALGLRYVFPSGNSLTYRMRTGSGDYFNRAPDLTRLIPAGFDEREHELRAIWAVTDKTRLSARLAHLQRRHPDIPQRDFSGPVGNVSIDWRATGKLSISGSVGRSIGAYQTDLVSFSTANRIAVTPVWSATAHVAFRLSFEQINEEFGGAIAASGLDRKDVTKVALIGMDWRPRESISLSASLQKSQRSSNLAGMDYKSNTANIAAKISF